MALNVASEKVAAALYVLPVIAVASIWHILLFYENPPSVTAGGILRHVLVEAPERALFWWLIALPIACVVLAGLYLTKVARQRNGAIVLCAIGIVVALAAWFTVNASLAGFVTLPLLASVPAVKGHLTVRWSGP